MTKKFTIEITGGGLEFGAGKITKTQYAYWQDRPDELTKALTNNFDYKGKKTPKSCFLKDYYSDYHDVASFSGPLMEECSIKITNEEGHVLLDLNPYQIAEKFEDEEEFLEYGEDAEFHSNNSFDVAGYFIKWRLNGTGVYFNGRFQDKEFSIQKLKISIFDVENDRIIDDVLYNGKSIHDDGGQWSYSSSDFEVGFNPPVD